MTNLSCYIYVDLQVADIAKVVFMGDTRDIFSRGAAAAYWQFLTHLNPFEEVLDLNLFGVV